MQNDAALLIALRVGEADALAEAMRRHGNWMTAVARRRVRDPALADDVVQAVFIVLARDARRVPAGRPLVGWLYRAAELSAAHALRGESRRRRHEREAGMQQLRRSTATDLTPDDAIAPIERAMRSLRPPFREAILLHFYEQRSTADAAAALAISPAAFRKRVARALDALRERIAERGGAVAPGVAIEATLRLPGVARPVDATAASVGPNAASLAIRVRRSMAARRLVRPVAATLAIVATFAAIVELGTPPREAARSAVAIATMPSTRQTDVTTRANEQLYLIRTATLTSTSRQWAEAALALIDLGPPAVPAIVAELDRTDRDLAMRVLPIVLRAIGDRRAVPALIRALPRTAINTSDFGLPLPRDVATRLLPHLIEPTSDARFDTPRASSVGIGRSVRETFASLGSLTGRRVASDDEWYREPEGHEWPASRVQAYRAELAERWRATADAVATTRPVDELPPAAAGGDDLVERAGVARFGPLFANHARLGPAHHAVIRAQGTMDSRAFFDFETNRSFEWLEGVDAVREPARARDFEDWSATLGIDLTMHTLFYEKQLIPPATQPGANFENCRHVAEPATLTMRLWPVPAARWDTFGDEVSGDGPIDPGAGPTENFAPHNASFDDGTRTFLFITADEAPGILRFGPQDAAATSRPIDYRLIDRGDARPGETLSDGVPPATLDPARPWATTRPTAFGETRRVMLSFGGGGLPGALDLDTDRTSPLPAELSTRETLGKRIEWARQNGFDVLPTYLFNGPIGGIELERVASADLNDAAWSEASATLTLERGHRLSTRAGDDQSFILGDVVSSVSTRTRVVRTAAGTIVLLRLVDLDAPRGTVTIEYKRVEQRS